MRTVKEVSEITGVSIRTLRYYDEIGLLKPTALTEAGYRLYDNKAIERLQEIIFFRELEIPLVDIREILDYPDYDKKQTLSMQKSLLERKRNWLNGIIELITDIMKGDNTMSFEGYSDEEIQKMVDHTFSCMPKERLEEQASQHGGMEKYREYLASGFQNEQAMADIFRWYGGKEKAMKAVLWSTGNSGSFEKPQDENEKIYRQFMKAKETDDDVLAADAVERLAENYKELFMLDNARNILLDLAKEYLWKEKLAEVTDEQYGEGCSEYVARAIRKYYGVYPPGIPS